MILLYNISCQGFADNADMLMVIHIIFILNTVFTYIYGRPLAWAWWAGASGWARTESRNKSCDRIQDSPRVLRLPGVFETAVVKVVAGNTDRTRA